MLKSQCSMKQVMFFISKPVGTLSNLLSFENVCMHKVSEPANHPPRWAEGALLLVAAQRTSRAGVSAAGALRAVPARTRAVPASRAVPTKQCQPPGQCQAAGQCLLAGQCLPAPSTAPAAESQAQHQRSRSLCSWIPDTQADSSLYLLRSQRETRAKEKVSDLAALPSALLGLLYITREQSNWLCPKIFRLPKYLH